MFNELSLKEASSKESARNIIETFIKSTIQASELGFTEIRLHEKTLQNLYQIPLCQDYKIDHWLKDPEINSDLQVKFRDIIANPPLITDAEISENELYQRSEFFKKIDNIDCLVWGLGAAHIYDTLSVSLGTNSEWDKNNISLLHYYLNENNGEENAQIIVKHFSNIPTLNTHIEWWEQLQRESLEKSIELWNRREAFFPNLILCNEVEKQLKKLGASKMLFQIIERLRTLDKYAKEWEAGSFDYKKVNTETNLRISPESDSTLNMFSSLRKFTVNGQGKKVFDLHIKTGDLRFHFYPDNEAKKIYIGYIGKHLRVASS